MAESPQDNEALEPKPTSGEPASSPPSRWRKWRRRLLWTGAILLVVSIVLRIALILALPTILKTVAGSFDLSCQYERLELSILGADAEIWHLTVEPAEGGEPFVDAEYCRLDVAVWPLLLGRIVIRRLEADGVDVWLDRDETGAIPFLERLVREAPKDEPPPESAEPESDDPPGAIDLSAPVRLDALRLQHMQVHVDDQSVAPPLETRLDMNLRVSHLGVEDRPIRFQLDLFSDPILDVLHVEGLVSGAGNEREVELGVQLRGLHPEALAGHLHSLGLRPGGKEVSARLELNASTKDASGSGGAVEVDLELRDLQAVCDGEVFLALDRLDIRGPSVGSREALVTNVTVQGGRLHASRTPSGAFRIGGVELDPARVPQPRAVEPVSAGEEASGGSATPSSIGRYAGVLESVLLRKLVLSFRDEAVVPATDLSLQLEQLTITDIIKDPERPDAALTFNALVRSPGLWEALVVEGTAVPFATEKTFESRVDVAGIAPEALNPYLEAVGAESTWEGGSLSLISRGALELTEDGGLGARLELEKVALRDREELLGVDRVSISGVDIHPDQGSFEVASVAIQGPRLTARRDAAGALEVLGIRLAPSGQGGHRGAGGEAPMEPGESEPEETTPVSPPGEQEPAQGRFRLGELSLTEGRFQLRDECVGPEVTHEIADAGLRLAGLEVNLAPGAPDPTPARLQAWLAAPGLCEKLSAQGTVESKGLATSMDLTIEGRGITGRSLAPYLETIGIEPDLEDAAGDLRLRAGCDLSDSGVRLDLRLSEAQLRDREQELLGVDDVRVQGVRLASDSVQVEAIELNRPRARAWRTEDGSVHALGLAYSGVPPKSETEQPASPESVELPETGEVPGKPGAKRHLLPLGSTVLALETFRVSGATLQWSDPLVEPALDTTLTVDSELEGFRIQEGAEPARFRASCKAEGLLAESSLSGTVSLEPDAARLTMEASARGLRAAGVQAYFPEGVEPRLEKGRAGARLETGLSLHPEGGLQAELTLSDLEFRDEAADSDLFRLETARLLAGRIDLEAGTVLLKECSVAGLETSVERTSEGGLALLGLHLISPEQEEAADVPRKQPDTQAAPADGEKAVGVAQGDAPDSGEEAAAKAPAATALVEELPLVQLEKLDVNLRRLTFTDRARVEAEPVVLSDLRFSNDEPVALLGDDPDSNPSVKLAVEGRIQPVVESFRVDAELHPFHDEPTVQVVFAAAGVRGQGITSVVPELRELVDGSLLEDGRFQAELEATLAVERVGAMGFDLSREFGGDLTIQNVAFRNTEEGRVLLGLEELTVTKLRVNPRSGDLSTQSVEITKPQGHVFRDQDGLHVLDLVIKLPEAPESAAEASEGEPSPEAAGTETAGEEAGGDAVATEEGETGTVPGTPEVASGQPEEPAGSTGPEIRLDQLVISECDLLIEDLSVNPPLRVPLVDLDVEARGLTSHAQYKDEPIFFAALLKAGKVPLRAPQESGIISGALSDAGAVLTGDKVEKQRNAEARVLFEEIRFGAEIILKPPYRGRARVVLNDFELEGLRGSAAEFGVNIESGLLDTLVDIVFTEDGFVDTDARVAFADLSVSEPPDGPIYRYLHLPAPLQTVVFTLRDQNGILRVPLGLRMESENFSGGNYLTAITTTLGKLLGAAFLKAPVRVGAAVTGLVPFVGGGEEEVEEVPVVIEYGPGETRLNGAHLRALAPLVERLLDGEPIVLTLSHELGGGDIALASTIANPSRQDIEEVVARLRHRQARLIEERRATATEALVTLSAGLDQRGTRARTRLRAIESELGAIEGDLDRLYAFLRKGAERRAQKRTRTASIVLGQDRLVEVRKSLQTSLGWERSELEKRVRLTRPRFRAVTNTPNGRVTLIAGPEEGE